MSEIEHSPMNFEAWTLNIADAGPDVRGGGQRGVSFTIGHTCHLPKRAPFENEMKKYKKLMFRIKREVIVIYLSDPKPPRITIWVGQEFWISHTPFLRAPLTLQNFTERLRGGDLEQFGSWG